MKRPVEMTVAELILEAQALYDAIFVADCFSVGDLAAITLIQAELYKRGYEMQVEKRLLVQETI